MRLWLSTRLKHRCIPDRKGDLHGTLPIYAATRKIMRGVSPSFAMTKMDLEQHPELDIYVEDEAAQVMLREIIVTHSANIISRCLIVPSGAASVGQSLGQMAHQNR